MDGLWGGGLKEAQSALTGGVRLCLPIIATPIAGFKGVFGVPGQLETSSLINVGLIGLIKGGGRWRAWLRPVGNCAGGEQCIDVSLEWFELKLDADELKSLASSAMATCAESSFLRLSREEPKMARCRRGEPSNVFCGIFGVVNVVAEVVGLSSFLLLLLDEDDDNKGDGVLRANLGEANILKKFLDSDSIVFDSASGDVEVSRFISKAACILESSLGLNGKFIGW